jgi:hypothetical protein
VYRNDIDFLELFDTEGDFGLPVALKVKLSATLTNSYIWHLLR